MIGEEEVKHSEQKNLNSAKENQTKNLGSPEQPSTRLVFRAPS
jgi:hypothetical protein